MSTIEDRLMQTFEGTPQRRSRITATACPAGVTMPSPYVGTAECSTDLEAAAIGEAVVEAVYKAWKDGHDPAIDPYVVLVTFR